MPRISAFYGIGIWMYWNEGVHAMPHFHARAGEGVASVDFDGRIIAGRLPAREHRLVREWSMLHRAVLQANWQRAADGRSLVAIPPLT